MRMMDNGNVTRAPYIRRLCVLIGLVAASSGGPSAQSQTHAKPAPPSVQIPKVPGASTSPPGSAAVPAPAPLPPDPLGRSTPHGTVIGFLHAAEAQDYARAAKYLDTKLPESKAEQLALELKVILDLGSSNNLETLSRQPEGNLADGLRVSREKVGVVNTPAGQIEILLDHVSRPNEEPIWLFSRETLDRVPNFYASTQPKDFSHYFPAWMSRIRIFSIPLWRWLAVIVAIILDLFLAWLLSRLVRWILRISLRRYLTTNVDAAIIKLTAAPSLASSWRFFSASPRTTASPPSAAITG